MLSYLYDSILTKGAEGLMVTIIEGGINSNYEDIFIQQIKKAAEENKDVLVLIPDQFSFEYDKKLYKALGAVNFNKIRTAGFNRLAELMAVQYGESGKENASENAKIIMMYKAVKRLRETRDVRFYSKSLDNGSFISELIRLVGQLRESGITPEALQFSAEKVNGSVSLKLFDIARIYKFYMEELENAKLKDSISSVAQSVKLAEKHIFFKGMNVFVNGFNNFTYDENNMLHACIKQSDNFTVSLTAEPESIKSFNNHPFTEVIKTEQEIKNIASQYNKSVEFLFADNDHFNSQEIRYIGKNLFNLNKKKYEGECEKVKVISSSDMYEETEFICAEIIRLVREENYKFRDIAVTVRDINACSSVFEGIFERYEIPYFIDSKNLISASSLVQYLNSLFRCVLTKQYKTENILKFVKSPLFAMLNYEISDLEDYCIKWNVDGDMWKSDFTAVQNQSESESYLEKINKSRKSVIEPLEKFKTAAKNTSAGEICRALYVLLNEIGLSQQTYSVVKRAGNSDNETQLELARGLKQLWNSVLSAVKSIYDCMGSERISLRQFYELFKLMLSQMSISNPPQKLDCVRICDAGHSRVSDVKVMFAAEVNDGIFPALVNGSGLITEREKTLLNSEGGIFIAENAQRTFQSEKLNSYFALAAPTDRLYVSYSESDLVGKEKRPSILVREISDMFGGDIFIKTSQISADFFCTSYKTAYFKYIEHFRDNTKYSASIGESLKNSQLYSGRLAHLRSVNTQSDFRLDEKIAENMFFKEDITKVSPSRLEEYYNCSFSYFCGSGLKLRKVQPVKLDGLNRGNIIHDLLEHIMKNDGSNDYDNNFESMTESDIRSFIHNEFTEYYKKEMGGNFGKTPMFDFLFEKLEDTAFYIVKFVQSELLQTKFRPVSMEYKIDRGEHGDTLTLELENGKKIILNGKIDRVDKYIDENGECYVRIIDYKTGAHMELNYSRIYLGLNLQMLFYLSAVIKQNDFVDADKKIKQAGVAYFKFGGSPEYISESNADDEETAEYCRKNRLKAFKPLGIVVDDEKIIDAYRSESYDYVPFNEKKNSLVSDNMFTALREFAVNKVQAFGNSLIKGHIEAYPIKDYCKYCDYKGICGNPFPERSKDPKDKAYADKLMEEIKKEADENEC